MLVTVQSYLKMQKNNVRLVYTKIMLTKILIAVIVVSIFIAAGIFIFKPNSNKGSLPALGSEQQGLDFLPSETLKTHIDEAGFSFNYPDNLSLINNEPKDTSTYADLKLSAKEINGSLALKISDSKLTSIDEWVKANNTSSKPPKLVSLGNLNVTEIETENGLLLAGVDQGVLFTIATNYGDHKDLWKEVTGIILKDFAFVSPAKETAPSQDISSSPDDIVFEGEEVVE